MAVRPQRAAAEMGHVAVTVNDPRPVRITSPRPARADHQTLAFRAQNADGDLQLFVTATHRASLLAEAPPMSDTDDRLDYALSRLEA